MGLRHDVVPDLLAGARRIIEFELPGAQNAGLFYYSDLILKIDLSQGLLIPCSQP